MTDSRSMTGARTGSANSKAIVVGLVLLATGGLVSVCGMGISGTAVVKTIRRWAMSQQPPKVIMKRKIAQAKAATAAGNGAWKDEMATAPHIG